MHAAQLLRSSAFRVALVYAVLFGASVLLLFGFIYWSTAGFMRQQSDATIEAEIAGLAERYRSDGLNGLTALIEQRLSRAPEGPSIYLFAGPDRRPIVGNLDRWPAAEPDAEGWIDFRLGESTRPQGESVRMARAKVFRLAGGFNLLVGRDMQELEAIEARIVRTLIWGVGMTALLALAGGVAVSYGVGRRLGSINVAIDEIMKGRLSRRLPTRDSGDELDLLVGNVNRMLTNIEAAMDDVRRVSDNIAHDLRTPLTRLRNRLELVRGATAPDNEEAVADAIHEADQLLQTFNALLRIARVESRNRTDGFRDVEIASLLADVADLYGPVAEARGQRLEVSVQSAPVIVADADLLFQALANLLDNAVKYVPRGGRIKLSLATDAATATIVVEDDGPGIPEALRGKALRRFWRLDDSRSSPGSGLGLSLVAAVARLHDAELLLEDAAPGLRVLLRLPAGA